MKEVEITEKRERDKEAYAGRKLNASRGLNSRVERQAIASDSVR